MDFRFLCSVRVCRALVRKYEHDPRHETMKRLYRWTGKEWVRRRL